MIFDPIHPSTRNDKVIASIDRINHSINLIPKWQPVDRSRFRSNRQTGRQTDRQTGRKEKKRSKVPLLVQVKYICHPRSNTSLHLHPLPPFLPLHHFSPLPSDTAESGSAWPLLIRSEPCITQPHTPYHELHRILINRAQKKVAAHCHSK